MMIVHYIYAVIIYKDVMITTSLDMQLHIKIYKNKGLKRHCGASFLCLAMNITFMMK